MTTSTTDTAALNGRVWRALGWTQRAEHPEIWDREGESRMRYSMVSYALSCGGAVSLCQIALEKHGMSSMILHLIGYGIHEPRWTCRLAPLAYLGLDPFHEDFKKGHDGEGLTMPMAVVRAFLKLHESLNAQGTGLSEEG